MITNSPPWRGVPKGRGGLYQALPKNMLPAANFSCSPKKSWTKEGRYLDAAGFRSRYLTRSGINNPRQEGQILTTRSRSLRNQSAGMRKSLVASESHTAALITLIDAFHEIEGCWQCREVHGKSKQSKIYIWLMIQLIFHRHLT